MCFMYIYAFYIYIVRNDHPLRNYFFLIDKRYYPHFKHMFLNNLLLKRDSMCDCISIKVKF